MTNLNLKMEDSSDLRLLSTSWPLANPLESVLAGRCSLEFDDPSMQSQLPPLREQAATFGSPPQLLANRDARWLRCHEREYGPNHE